MATASGSAGSTSRSLHRRGGADLQTLRTAYYAKYPPTIPDGAAWVNEGTRLKLFAGSGGGSPPMEVVSGPMEFVGFLHETAENPKTGQPASLQLKFETERPVSPTEVPLDAFWTWAVATFGPGGTLAAAAAEHFSTLVPAGKRPSGVKPQNAAKHIDADLQSKSGKPDFFCQPLKVRPARTKPQDDEEGAPMYKLQLVKFYLTDQSSVARELGTCPAEVEAPFAARGLHEHPILRFFRENPTAVPAQRLALTVADGIATPWEILAAASNAGASVDYFKVLGSVRLGGITVKYIDRRIFTLAAYANTPGGLQVVAVPAVGGQDASESPPDNDDLYGPPAPSTVYDAQDAALAAALDAEEDDSAPGGKRRRTDGE